jgi:lysyl-tRNA synthetase class 2
MDASFLPNASVETLRQRAALLARIREFFDQRGFFEVQTPVLSRDTVVDRYIDPLSIDVTLPGGAGQRYFLQTSPEFAMKRLLAAGAEAIYQIGPVFRAGESGAMHNIEFTMLEWYRAGDSYAAGMDLLDEFARILLGCPPARRLSWFDALREFSGVDLREDTGDRRWDELDIQISSGNRWDDAFVRYIEPRIAKVPSLILYDWPAEQSALARIREEAVPGRQPLAKGVALCVAERFELFVHGVELANGYYELTDAEELLARNVANNRVRQQDGRDILPVESRLLDAMRHGLPEGCGVALGVDRLVMLALGKSSIRDVLAFDTHRA